MPKRLMLPDGEPDLLIGAYLFWFAAGALAFLSLIRVLRGLLSKDPLKWACSALPVEQAVALQLDLRRCVNDPRKRPRKRTRHHATDALIFLSAAVLTAIVPLAVKVSNGTRSVEGDLYAMMVVSCIGSGILGLEGLRRGVLFLYAWRHLIGSIATLLIRQFPLWLVTPELSRFIEQRKRPAWRFSRPLLFKHLAWSAVLLPVAHLALLMGTYHFPPAEAGHFHHRELVVLDRLPFGSLYLTRMGIDRRGVLALTWKEIHEYAPNPEYSQNILGKLLWQGPRWYFCNAWNVSVGLSRKSAEGLGWTEERMADHASKFKADLDAIPEDNRLTGDELAGLLSACDDRFELTPGDTSYSISCNGLDGHASIGRKNHYRYLLTEDALILQHGYRATRLDCREGLVVGAFIPRTHPTGEMTGWRASLAFALCLIWGMLLLLLAPLFYVKWVTRKPA